MFAQPCWLNLRLADGRPENQFTTPSQDLRPHLGRSRNAGCRASPGRTLCRKACGFCLHMQTSPRCYHAGPHPYQGWRIETQVDTRLAGTRQRKWRRHRVGMRFARSGFAARRGACDSLPLSRPDTEHTTMSIVIKTPEEIERCAWPAGSPPRCSTTSSPSSSRRDHRRTRPPLPRLHGERAGHHPGPLNYAPPGYKPYPKSICTSINHQVCHGVPGDRR